MLLKSAALPSNVRRNYVFPAQPMTSRDGTKDLPVRHQKCCQMVSQSWLKEDGGGNVSCADPGRQAFDTFQEIPMLLIPEVS